MKEETKKQSTGLATTEAKPAPAPTPFGFMRRFASDTEQLFEDFKGFQVPSVFGREFFPLTREFDVSLTLSLESLLHLGYQLRVRTDSENELLIDSPESNVYALGKSHRFSTIGFALLRKYPQGLRLFSSTRRPFWRTPEGFRAARPLPE